MFATSTGGFLDPKPKSWEPPANRRKPRTYSTADAGQCDPSEWPIEFCMWLQSNEFGNNRRHILQFCGAKWLGEEVPASDTIFGGVQKWLNSTLRREEPYQKAGSECLQRPQVPVATPCPIEATQ